MVHKYGFRYFSIFLPSSHHTVSQMVTVKLLIAFAVPARHALFHRSGKAIMHSRKFEKIRPAFYTLLARRWFLHSPSFTATYWQSDVIVQKVKDEGKVKKNSLYIKEYGEEKKAWCAIFVRKICVNMPDGKTLRCFCQIALTSQTKRLYVSDKTLQRFKQNSSTSEVKRKGVLSQTLRRSENIRNGSKPLFWTLKRTRPHTEAFGGACRNIFPAWVSIATMRFRRLSRLESWPNTTVSSWFQQV